MYWVREPLSEVGLEVVVVVVWVWVSRGLGLGGLLARVVEEAVEWREGGFWGWLVVDIVVLVLVSVLMIELFL